MKGKFLNKYRIDSARAVWWDYGKKGGYFVTICTQNRKHFFGECKNGKMQLSTMGAIVQGFWYDIPKHFAHVVLGEFQVMPDHIHGILILQSNAPISEKNGSDSTGKDVQKFYSSISPKAGSVPVILRSFKSICTKHINLIFPDLNFGWQERFHDHIIRDDGEYERIANYIINNPLKWGIGKSSK
ncbi:MAG: transposase [Cytophagaceae bacterium]